MDTATETQEKRVDTSFSSKTKAPELILDRDHGIDLVATSKDSKEINYYQIKGLLEACLQANRPMSGTPHR
jgi:hypothetical protein